MVSKEDIIELFGTSFRRFLYDNFISTEQINEAVSQTAAVTSYIGELELATGIQEASTCKIYYNRPFFNTLYGPLIWKMQLSSTSDVFVFIGLKSTADDPSFDMTESHAGFMINSGTFYFSTGDGDNQQRTPLSGFLPTNNIIYKIQGRSFFIYPLPIQYPYFDGFRYEFPVRAWSSQTTNSTYPQENQDHYFVAFIRNTTGANKYLRIKHIVYGEEYAD